MPPPSPLTLSQQLTQKARAALEVGRPKEAVPLLLQALRCVASGKEGAYVMCFLSKAFARQEDWNAALMWADRAVAAAPENEWAYRSQAFALDALGRPAEAMQSVFTARGLSPETPWNYQILARLYADQNDYEQATKNALRFRELAPEDSDAFFHLANIAVKRAEKERNKGARNALLVQAETHLRDGLTLDPESRYLLVLLGKLREMQSRGNEAIPHYIKSIRQTPNGQYEKDILERKVTYFLFDTIAAVSLVGIPIQIIGLLLHWGAWFAFGVAITVTFCLAVPVGSLPLGALRFHPSFRRLAVDVQATLLQMAARRKQTAMEKDGPVTFALFITIIFNIPPLLLRGLWNAGVWAFHALWHG